jgi:hypothetical protein
MNAIGIVVVVTVVLAGFALMDTVKEKDEEPLEINDPSRNLLDSKSHYGAGI